MKTFKQFLLEASDKDSTDVQGTSISSDELMHLFETDFSDAYQAHLNNNHYIARGWSVVPTFIAKTGCGIAHVESSTRRSQNTSNFYTAILDTSPAMRAQKFPLRSKSLICSTSKAAAEGYSDWGASHSISFVLPKNGAHIGVTPKSDIWYTPVKFPVGDDRLFQSANSLWSHLFKVAGIQAADSNIRKIIRYFEQLQDYFSEAKRKGASSSEYKQLAEVLQSALTVNDKEVSELFDRFSSDILDFLYNFCYLPERTGLSCVTTSQIVSIEKNREVWVSGDILLVSSSVWEALK